MRDDELERLLQAGLESYAEAEPRLGIEERVLRRVQVNRSRRSRLWFGWSATAAATACVLMLAFLWLAHTGREQAPKISRAGGVASQATSPGNLSAPVVLPEGRPAETGAARVLQSGVAHESAKRIEARRESEPRLEKMPKLAVFPTPRPLSPEERALAELVNQHPKLAKEVLVDTKKRSTEPIQTAEIHIEPLMIDGPQQEGETNAKDQ